MKEKKANKTSYAHVFLGLGGSLFMIMLSSTNLYEIAELKTYDQRFLQRTAIFGPIRMDPNLATVNVDDRTLASEGRWQDWTRDKHAKIVRSIHEFGGRMVGFDVFFLEPSEVKVSQEQLLSLEIFNRDEVLSLVMDYDGDLASAFRESGIVYLGQYLDAMEEGDQVRPLDPEREGALETLASKGLLIPYPEGRETTLKVMRDIHPPLNSLVEAAKGVGFAQADPDVDGTRRKFPLVLFYEGRIVPSLALIMVCDYLQVPLTNIKVEEGEGYIRLPNAHMTDGGVKDIEIPIDPKGQLLVNWAGGFLETFQSFPHITISRLSEDRKALEALRIVKRIFVEYPEAQGDFEQLVALAQQQGVHDPGLVGGYQASLEVAGLMEQAVRADPHVKTSEVFAQLFGLTMEQVPADLGPDSPASEIEQFAPSEEYVSQVRGLLTTLDAVRINNLVAQQMDRDGIATPEQIASRIPGVSTEKASVSVEILGKIIQDGKVQATDRPLYFPPFKPITILSMGKVQQVTPDDIKGKVFFYGLTATGTHDINPTPYEAGYPLVGIYPNVFNTIITENFLKRVSDLMNDLVVLGLGLLMGFMVPRFKALDGALWMVILMVSYIVGAFLLFTHGGIWIDLVGPVGTLVFGYLSITIYNYIQKEKERDFVQGAFGHYLDPKVVENLVENPEMVDRLGGEERLMTVFFSDVASFSTICENLMPTDLVALLNQYLTEMCDLIGKQGGTIDKFEGDAIIAFYGAPIPTEDHAERAVLACIDMQDEIDKLRKGWEERGEMTELRQKWAEEGRGDFFQVRMGVNTGRMVVGNMGSKTRVDYTVMGDAVNLAARLETAGKQYGVLTMISEETYEKTAGIIEARLLDAIRVVGKEEPVKVFEILGRKGQVDPARMEASEVFAKGYEMYTQKKWDEAIAYFEAALKARPNEGPSHVFVKRCQEYKLNPPPADWDSVYTLESK